MNKKVFKKDDDLAVIFHSNTKQTILNSTKSMGELYKRLRELVADNYVIAIRDRSHLGHPEVTIQSLTNSCFWTSFQGKTIEVALERAISKLEHPEQDYTDIRGKVWKAKESSVFSEEHIKLFLRT